MKYIDSEKLIAEIERLKELHKGLLSGKFRSGYNSAFQQVLSFIASLQQEPRFPKYDNIVDKVFGAGNLEGFEYREAEMLVALAKEELLKSLQQEQPTKGYDEKYLNEKIAKAKKSWEGVDVDEFMDDVRGREQHEQPEVDLEEYIENEVKHYGLSLYEASYGTFSASQIDRIIRNAFELGLNTRKEE